jgi:hypothetical protein
VEPTTQGRRWREGLPFSVRNKAAFEAGVDSVRARPQGGLVRRPVDRRGTRNKFQDLDPVEDPNSWTIVCSYSVACEPIESFVRQERHSQETFMAMGCLLHEPRTYRSSRHVTDSAITAGCGARRWDGYAMHDDWHLDRVVLAIRSATQSPGEPGVADALAAAIANQQGRE